MYLKVWEYRWVIYYFSRIISQKNICNILQQQFDVLKGFRIDLQTSKGQGAYSIVYKVQRLADKKVYALKKVKLANLSEKQIQNALNQVRILASFKNNYIVGYKEVFLEGKNLCIIMEFADDGDLYQKIVEHKKSKTLFQENQIWNVLIQILLGLKSLHAHNILHRDLKSANIFLNKSGQAKLGDLNVSKVAKNGLLYTQTGTPYYASPEVWKDQPYDAKSDIWSLGCVIYEMTTLQPPFQAEDMEGLMKSVTLGVYPPINSQYSKQLSHIIKMMLQQKAKLRPSAEKIFTSNLIQKKIQQLKMEAQKMVEQTKSELLKTIRIPKKLHYLTQRLPKPNYDNLSDPGQSADFSPKLDKNQKNSLPKLNRILEPNISAKGGDKRKKKSQVYNDGLMIQGRSKVIQDARNHQKIGKNLDKQIRDELKKIYKVRGAGQSYDARNAAKKRSQRSIILPPIRL